MRKNDLTKMIKRFPWIMLSCCMIGGGVAFAYETIGFGIGLINLINAEKLP